MTYNIEMFKDLRNLVAAKPEENFNMLFWAKELHNDKPVLTVEKLPWYKRLGYWLTRKKKPVATCGTSLCLAGWTMVLADDVEPLRLEVQIVDHNIDRPAGRSRDEIGHQAAKILGLSWAEAQILFFTNQWPTKYRWDEDDNDIPERDGALMFLDDIIAGEKIEVYS